MQGALLVLTLLLFGATPEARAADAAVSVQVPAGQSRSIRLRNLPAGASMAVRVLTSGKLLVALVGEKQIREARGTPVFRAVVERRIAFKVVIPEAGNYFLVLGNRGGAETREVQAEIRALRAPEKRPPTDHSPRPEKASWSPVTSSM